MQYSTPYLVTIGIIYLVLWSLDYWKIIQTAQLFAPIKNLKDDLTFKIVRIVTYIVGLLGIVSLSYSMSGPRLPLKFDPSNIVVNDIFFVLDVSRSMLVDDLRPNRLEVAKEKMREFVKLRPKDRIGVVLFSEDVFTLLPLTTDTNVVEQEIKNIRVGFLGSGTNIGDGLALAVARGTQSETKNKVIILLTDGVSNVGNMTPLQAAEYAKKYNIKVYTIGIGTDESAKLPVGQGVFGKRYINIPGGSIDMKTLQEISKMTGGKSYYANSKKSLESILSDIENLERTKIKAKGKVVYKELYLKYLLIGVFLFLFSELSRRFYIRDLA